DRRVLCPLTIVGPDGDGTVVAEVAAQLRRGGRWRDVKLYFAVDPSADGRGRFLYADAGHAVVPLTPGTRLRPAFAGRVPRRRWEVLPVPGPGAWAVVRCAVPPGESRAGFAAVDLADREESDAVPVRVR